ncbi:MAG: ABC transporter permease [Spirochaetaceae bacterium]|nr:ABC transporter permease [Spirochaetaceae bacterium]
MGSYIARRFLFMLLLLAMLTVAVFVIIQLPPGDFLTHYVTRLEAQGVFYDQEQTEQLRRIYGLDLPMYRQYLRWLGRIASGDLGMSLQWRQPVSRLLADRLPYAVIIAVVTLLFTYAVAIPIGVYSATHQYSLTDYAVTTLGFVGLATPNFLLALILMFLANRYLGFSIGGLFSIEYIDQPWSAAKLLDMLGHLPVPIVVIGTAGTAQLIRVLRSSLLDELSRQYVITARAKGLTESRLLFRYPVRVALNPVISTVGWVLPEIFSGQVITAIVLSLPTIGPLLLAALVAQDMFLAGSLVMVTALLTLLGTFLSDILLVAVDPRIRMAG